LVVKLADWRYKSPAGIVTDNPTPQFPFDSNQDWYLIKERTS
jgi:hypothetical protein